MQRKPNVVMLSGTMIYLNMTSYYVDMCGCTSLGYSIIVLSGVCGVGSEKHSKISGHMTSAELEFLIPVSAEFWREL